MSDLIITRITRDVIYSLAAKLSTAQKIINASQFDAIPAQLIQALTRELAS